MEARSNNRLCPAAPLLTAASLTNGGRHHGHSTSATAGLPRRRCRSESLPLTSSLVGVPVDAKLYDELSTVQRNHHRRRPQQPPPPPQPVSNGHFASNKYSPVAVLRNQDSTKNIFSYSPMSGGRQHMFKKDMMVVGKFSSASASMLPHQARVQEYERTKMQTRHSMSKKVDFLDGDHSIQSPKVPVLLQNGAACRGPVDGHKRRVRSLSDSDPHDLHMTGGGLTAREGRYLVNDVSVFAHLIQKLVYVLKMAFQRYQYIVSLS